MRLLPALLLFSLSAAAAPPKPVMIPIGNFDEEIVPVRKKIEELTAAGETHLYFKIDSYGGDVETGWRLVSLLREAKKKGARVSCFVDWQAYSMGAYFLEGACDDRWAAPNAAIMFHTSATQAEGHAQNLRDALAREEAIDGGMVSLTAKRLGMAPEAFLAKIDGKEWWLSADAALAAHVIDAVKDGNDLPPLISLEQPKLSPLEALRKLLTGH